MASITDCVSEGLKYPFRDVKKVLGLGVLFALISAISVFINVKSLDIFTQTVHMVEKTNVTLSHLTLSQLPAGDIYLVAGLAIVIFIISLFIFGYQYNIVKFSIEKKDGLPGFGNVLDMFIKGIKYFIVMMAYYIIPIIVLVVGIMLIGKSQILAVFAIVLAVLFIIAFFLQIMALNNMIAHDSFKKAFDLREIIGNISNLGWSKYIGIIVFTFIVFMIINVAVSFILSFITVVFAATISNQAVIISVVIAVIEGLFVDSYGTLFLNRVFGSVYRESIK